MQTKVSRDTGMLRTALLVPARALAAPYGRDVGSEGVLEATLDTQSTPQGTR